MKHELRTVAATLCIAGILTCSPRSSGNAGAPAASPKASVPATAVAPIQAGLVILEPDDNDTVVDRPLVRGSVSDSSVTTVWLVVHPLMTPGDFWVQPPATVADSHWQTQPYIGDLEHTKPGEVFEVRAFAMPATGLTAGRCGGWPEADLKSALVTWVRR